MKQKIKTVTTLKGKYWVNTKGVVIREKHFDGYKAWYDSGGKRHRKNGPAVINKGLKMWWYHGTTHREDGPALVFPDGRKEYRLNGIAYSEPDFYKKLYELGKITKEEFFIYLI